MGWQHSSCLWCMCASHGRVGTLTSALCYSRGQLRIPSFRLTVCGGRSFVCAVPSARISVHQTHWKTLPCHWLFFQKQLTIFWLLDISTSSALGVVRIACHTHFQFSFYFYRHRTIRYTCVIWWHGGITIENYICRLDIQPQSTVTNYHVAMQTKSLPSPDLDIPLPTLLH